MSRLLLVGEGPHDVGRRNWSVRAGDFAETDGWLQPLVRRLRASEGDDLAIYLRELVVLPRGRHEPQPLASALARKAQIAKFRAMTEQCIGVVLATDADSVTVAERDAKEASMNEGFEAYPGDIHSVACVPMGTSEAWLLSDPNAWSEVAGQEVEGLPSHPERTWGEAHNPNSGHPKQLFGRICRTNGIDDDQVTRAELAVRADLDRLTQRCQRSFRPFRDAMSEI